MLSPRGRARIGLAAASLVFTIAFTVVLAGSFEKPNLHVGQIGSPLLGFRLPDADGSIVSSSSLRGSVAVLCFATTPEESADSMARMAQLGQAFASNGNVKLVTIFSNTEDMDDAALRRVKDAAIDAGAACTVLLDPSNWTANRYRVEGAEPTFFVVDAAGTIRYRGAIDDPRPDAPLASTSFSTLINLLLTERPLPGQSAPAVLSNIK